MAKRALITGITGQDGHYLAHLLHEQDYEVYGLVQSREHAPSDLPPCGLIEGELRAAESLTAALEEAQPDEIYNLAAITSVAYSFDEPELVADVNGVGVLRLLRAIRLVMGDRPSVQFYQASSSEMFGAVTHSPQDETTPFRPQSPYATAKVFAHHLVEQHRRAHGMFAVSGIFYNHASPRRPARFVTRKITQGVARIAAGLQDELVLGDLDVARDWGFAGDYALAMWLMLQADEPRDYVVATGEAHTVRDVVRVAFAAVGIDDWERYVRQDERFLRPADPRRLVGDATRARVELGWRPTVGFEELIAGMVAHDLALVGADVTQSRPPRLRPVAGRG